MMQRIRIAIFIVLVMLMASVAMAEGSHSESDYPQSITGPRLFSYTSFHLNFGTVFYTGAQANQDLQVFSLNPGATIGILPELSLDLDIYMDIISGDRSDFVFRAFGTGINYIVFNAKPFIVTTGIGFKLMNQSLNVTFSPDVFYMRPYLATGMSVWRMFFSPYIGVPIYIDINNDNDSDTYPDRDPNYFMDQDPWGIDYGVPIGLMVLNGFYLTVEPSGITYFQPDTDTFLFVTPGFMYHSGFFRTGLGVQIQVYPEPDKYNRWQIVASAGAVF